MCLVYLRVKGAVANRTSYGATPRLCARLPRSPLGRVMSLPQNPGRGNLERMRLIATLQPKDELGDLLT